MLTEKIEFSCELFPPTTLAGHQKLHDSVRQLHALGPQFFSVTFGAGGFETHSLTTDVIQALTDQRIVAAPHMTCVNLSHQEVDRLLAYYRSLHISRLVVIRGDLSETAVRKNPVFLHTADLVRYIREKTGNYFEIFVGAYPEFHPESADSKSELFFLKEKIDSGANAAITQYFFSADAYYYFLENCHRLHLSIPVIPGIMPIMSYEKLVRFSKRCQAEIPRWLLKRLETYQNDSVSLMQFGIDVVSKLCEDVVQYGASRLHFYTLNCAEPCVNIIKNLQINSQCEVLV